jgi:peroxiredoxin
MMTLPVTVPALTAALFVRALLCCALGLLALDAQASVAPGAAAPDFTLRSSNGPNLRLQEQRGRVVLVNFWATWCGPCRQEMPQLAKLYDKYRSAGFVILGVSVDDDAGKAGEVARSLGLAFPVLLDSDKAVSKLYDLATMPTTYLIDRDGRVRYLHRGYVAGTEDAYDREIRELLK